jgi:hypothetical protein
VGVGEYNINFSNNMANANYAPIATTAYVGSSYNVSAAMLSTVNTSYTKLMVFLEGSTYVDVTTCSFVAFGD